MSSPTAFKTIPAQDELSEIPRDLSFHPCHNPTPKVLTTEQVARFNRDGYLLPFRIFTDAEVGDLRRYFDGLLARYTAE
ncbi:MAG TPA: phytanoyl-CoA dioxygenase family protein, partial [Gemmataceae bacterium]|nr:phytanoyl-CoA dioxygenase family protein [Gemmataceae bacterium]